MNKIGRFGEYGGQYVPEIVMNAVNELNEAYETYKNDPEFLAQLRQLYRDYANRPSLLYYAEKMTKDLGGAKVYLKREDLNHTGAHKINNVLGQILLAKRMGKKRIIAETGAGQHGVATATVAALFDMECVVYMGAEDVERQSLNAYRMELLGAKVHAVESGTRTLKDAINEAMRDWATNIETTFYCIGSVMGPHPYPTMVRDFQKIIGEETKEQMKEKETAKWALTASPQRSSHLAVSSVSVSFLFFSKNRGHPRHISVFQPHSQTILAAWLHLNSLGKFHRISALRHCLAQSGLICIMPVKIVTVVFDMAVHPLCQLDTFLVLRQDTRCFHQLSNGKTVFIGIYV